MSNTQPEKMTWQTWLLLMWLMVKAAVSAAFAVTILVFILLALGRTALNWVQHPGVLLSIKIPTVVVATVVVGAALFFFRLKFRLLYGLTETAFGGLAAYRLAFSATDLVPFRDPTFQVGLMTAGVYIIVRGLDNIHQGATEEPIDAMWALFKASRKN